MANRKIAAKSVAPSQSGRNEVDEFMRKLDDPLKPALEAVRSIIPGVGPNREDHGTRRASVRSVRIRKAW